MRATTILMVLLILSGACGTPGGSGTTIDHPAGATDLVFQVEQAGGLLPPGADLAQVPTFSVYGDGRLIMTGPQIEIFPPPALPPLLETRIGEPGIQRTLEEAREAGLFDPLDDYGQPPVADAPFTVFTIVAGGEERQVTVYALGFEDPGFAQMSEEQAEARTRLMEFQGELFDLEALLGGDTPAPVSDYEPERVALLVRAVDEGVLDEELAQESEWPAELPGISGGADPTCLVTSGEEADRVMELGRESNMLTYFRTPDGLFQVTFRPMLPDEDECGDLSAPGLPAQP